MREIMHANPFDGAIYVFRAKRSLRNFLANDSGVAAVEFSPVAPILILLLLAGFSYTPAIRVKLYLANATSDVAQIAAHQPNASASRLLDICAA